MSPRRKWNALSRSAGHAQPAARPTRRRGLWLAGLLVFIASALWHLPMPVAARALLAQAPDEVRAGLSLTRAAGVWHDGDLALTCTGVDKLALDCGDYHLTLRPDGVQALTLAARQRSGGTLDLRQPLAGGAVTGTVRQLRLPIGALALGLPILTQLQLSGPLTLNGEFSLPQRARLDGVWTGRIGDSALPPQALRLEVSNGTLDLRLAGSPDWPKVEGQVLCEGQTHCRGEVFIRTRPDATEAASNAGTTTDGSKAAAPASAAPPVDPRLLTLLGAVAREVSPGRFRVLIDGKGR